MDISILFYFILSHKFPCIIYSECNSKFQTRGRYASKCFINNGDIIVTMQQLKKTVWTWYHPPKRIWNLREWCLVSGLSDSIEESERELKVLELRDNKHLVASSYWKTTTSLPSILTPLPSISTLTRVLLDNEKTGLPGTSEQVFHIPASSDWASATCSLTSCPFTIVVLFRVTIKYPLFVVRFRPAFSNMVSKVELKRGYYNCFQDEFNIQKCIMVWTYTHGRLSWSEKKYVS